MSRLPRFALLAVLGLGAPLLPGLASAAPLSAAPMIGDAAAGTREGLLQDVRYVNRCRPVIVHSRDRFGRPVRVQREQCRRVWVGRRGPPPVAYRQYR